MIDLRSTGLALCAAALFSIGGITLLTGCEKKSPPPANAPAPTVEEHAEAAAEKTEEAAEAVAEKTEEAAKEVTEAADEAKKAAEESMP